MYVPSKSRPSAVGRDPSMAAGVVRIGRQSANSRQYQVQRGFAKVDITLARADLTVGRMTHCQSLTNR